MSTVTISLPDELRAFVEKRTADHGYADPGDYLSRLLLDYLDRERLRDLLLEGANSPPGPVADDEYFEKRLARLLQQDGSGS